MKELCEVYHKNEFTQLCDYATGSGIVTSIDFQELSFTCDKKMCKDCATQLWHNCEVCPKHAKEIKYNLIIGGK